MLTLELVVIVFFAIQVPTIVTGKAHNGCHDIKAFIDKNFPPAVPSLLFVTL